ncbi:MAG TPA: hypothetical protein VF796_01845, partial [Humisphaera sp.]
VERRVPDGLFDTRVLPPDHPRTPFASLFVLAWIVPSVVVLRRSVYERAGGWDEAMGHVYEDADLFLRMSLLAPVHYLPRPLVRYRRHAAQSTASADRVAEQERKLRAKWRRPDGLLPGGLTPAQHREVDAAWRFYEHRIVPRAGMSAGTRCLLRLRLGAAARFYGGAVRRYAGGIRVALTGADR